MMKRILSLGAIALGVAVFLAAAQMDDKKPATTARSEPYWSLKMAAPLEMGIVCSDMDRMLDFYAGVLGLKLVGDAETTPEMSTKAGSTPDGYRIIRLQTPNGERVKLVQPKKAPTKQSQAPQWVFDRQGTAYITFVVADIKEVTARLRDHGVKLLSAEPIEVRKGVFGLFSQDPEGNYVEFVEFSDPASYRPDIYKWHQFF